MELTYGDLKTTEQETRGRWFLMDSEGNEFSANRNDYFMFSDDEPIVDEYDEPMSLAYTPPKRVRIVK